jgi:hypothetical protein
MKIHYINFKLAKFFYQEFHRTNEPPVGHKASYVGLLGDDWHCLADVELDIEDLPPSWLDDSNYDIRVRGNDAGNICLYTRGQIVGICSIGRPVARWRDLAVHEITRICFNFHPQSNKERKYFSKLIREAIKDFAQNHHVSKFVTYIHDYQKGRYLEYAGFKKDKHIKYSKNSKGWGSRKNRSFSDLRPKYRFVKNNTCTIC